MTDTLKYLKLKAKIEQKESKINSGIITNGKTLNYAKKDIKRWKKHLNNLKQSGL